MLKISGIDCRGWDSCSLVGGAAAEAQTAADMRDHYLFFSAVFLETEKDQKRAQVVRNNALNTNGFLCFRCQML